MEKFKNFSSRSRNDPILGLDFTERTLTANVRFGSKADFVNPLFGWRAHTER